LALRDVRQPPLDLADARELSESVIAEQDMLKFGEIRFLAAAILPKVMPLRNR
jgi:hypothetical protein